FEAREHLREPPVCNELALRERMVRKYIRVAYQHRALKAAQKPMQFVNDRVQSRIFVKVDIALLRGFANFPDSDIVKIKQALQPDKFPVEQIQQANDLIVKRKVNRQRVHESENALDDIAPYGSVVQDVRPT